MSICGITHPAHDTVARDECRSPRFAPIRTVGGRFATHVRNAVRDHRPAVMLSEQAISDIHGVHSVHR